MIDLKYVLVFLKYQDEILLLNREKPSWMGCWNGIGGKIEKGETPTMAAIRETFEETGINITEVKMLSRVGWIINDDKTTLGGMYCFISEVSSKIKTPVKTDEGIIDFKKIDWILNEKNFGVSHNIKKFLPSILKNEVKDYMTFYKDEFDSLIKVEEIDIENW